VRAFIKHSPFSVVTERAVFTDAFMTVRAAVHVEAIRNAVALAETIWRRSPVRERL
jgi:hypothetical protein